MTMDQSNNQTNTNNVQVCPLNAGIDVGNNQVKDPNNGLIYNIDSWWGSILKGNSTAWHDWWEYN